MLQEQQLQAPILTAMSPGLNDSDPEVQSLTDSEAGEGYNEAPKQYICCIGQVKPLQLTAEQNGTVQPCKLFIVEQGSVACYKMLITGAGCHDGPSGTL